MFYGYYFKIHNSKLKTPLYNLRKSAESAVSFLLSAGSIRSIMGEWKMCVEKKKSEVRSRKPEAGSRQPE